VEQLRTHARHLNALHPAKGGKACVELYEKGYGKDAAGVAAEAISHAKDNRHDVVLVDTAGRMQDNEPLMRALAKVSCAGQSIMIRFKIAGALTNKDSLIEILVDSCE